MTNITFAQQITDGLIAGGNAYTYVGTTTGTPTDNVGIISATGIGGITYTNADSQGKTVYSKGERALAGWEYGNGQAEISVVKSMPSPKYFHNFVNGAPTVNDDSTEDFIVGARWLDRTTGRLYICSDVSSGAAVWTWTNTKGTLDTGTNFCTLRYWGGPRIEIWQNNTNTGYTQSSGVISETDSKINTISPGTKIGYRYGSSLTPFTGFRYNLLPYTS